MQTVIPILNSVSADKFGYEFLCELYADMHSVVEGDIVIDFGRCKLFDANLSAILGAIFDKRQNEGRNIFLLAPQSPGVRRVLSRNKFFEAFDVRTSNEDRDDYIIYKSFGVSDTLAFKQYVDAELIQKPRFPKCTDKAKEKIIESIYEIFANAVSHGGCSHVYCCGEMHSRNNKNTLDMTIVNLGLSVVDNVNKYMSDRNKPVLASCKALEWAFEEGNTTKQITGGLGLAILKQFIDMNKGRIQMVSGDAMLEIEQNNHVETPLSKWFPGTIVTVEFNCDDNKKYLMRDEEQNTSNIF